MFFSKDVNKETQKVSELVSDKYGIATQICLDPVHCQYL